MKFAKKSLGQNFLIDKNVIKKIINSVKIENKDVIEIGPGQGALTTEILKNKPKSIILKQLNHPDAASHCPSKHHGRVKPIFYVCLQLPSTPVQ